MDKYEYYIAHFNMMSVMTFLVANNSKSNSEKCKFKGNILPHLTFTTIAIMT